MTASEPTIESALAQHFDQFHVGDRLHEVPPHQTDAVTVDGQRAVCKLATGPQGDPETEARVYEFVAEATTVPVPEILAVGADHFVAAWHEDASPGPDCDVEKARTMGAGLATLHAETAGHFERPGHPRATADGLEVDAYATWGGTLRRHLESIREYLADHEDACQHVDVADAAIAFLREHPDALSGCGEPVLCHGNYLPDHVATRDGEVTCVVDFEHALVGPGEYDLWRTALPLLSHEDDQLFAAFREGYESVRALPPGVDDRRRCYEVLISVSYLQALYLQNQHDAETTSERATWLREFVLDGLDDLTGGETRR
ncbi:phosphotransferase family protein [Haloarchaeobius amylolyticus]|uniref:phosphotransferase family protein n=1 Tax=Haloarchaeobius amylolyticus TaxID=1198296 RepID=UPI002271810A|nr:aminoglycoside phosphotransferase family protein [Haloarchaeobius amylolyticus]